jgi:hypothetical protein
MKISAIIEKLEKLENRNEKQSEILEKLKQSGIPLETEIEGIELPV